MDQTKTEKTHQIYFRAADRKYEVTTRREANGYRVYHNGLELGPPAPTVSLALAAATNELSRLYRHP